MEWYLKVFRQYADFKGRARRKEYWMFGLFNAIFVMIGALVVFLLTSIIDEITAMIVMGGAIMVYCLVIMIPSLAVTVRRLHDTGKSGWFILLNLIPYIGGLVLFIFMCIDSDYGENKWGPNPKDIGNTTEIDQIGIN